MKETELALMRRLGAPERHILIAQSNLAATYSMLGQMEKALSMERDIYSGRVKLNGEEDEKTLNAADNYAQSLLDLRRFKEAKRVLRKVMPVAARVLGIEHALTLSIREDLCLSLIHI